MNSAEALASSVGRRSHTRIAGYFVAGLLTGGLLIATAIWIISGLLRWVPYPAAVVAVSLVAALAILRDGFRIDVPFPQSFRQVPQSVLRLDPRWGLYRFGLDMGTGVRTKMTASGTYVLALGVALAGLPLASTFIVGLGFGLGRGVAVYARYEFIDRSTWDARFAARGAYLKSTIVVATSLAVLMRLGA